MAVLTLRDDQVLDIVLQLPDNRRSWLFRQLLQYEWPTWLNLSVYAAEQARKVAADRGLDWDSMPEEEREGLVDTLLHEPG
ncbi:MAG: hypothetical protein KJZ86_04845 [Caldilineaceae bacterium]|nr:hypothetical protein [Caldilineaceae bacterium]HRJ43209.1 hypothetical protein [Caldilineaceae bacterium]